jgi:hypothetical protein
MRSRAVGEPRPGVPQLVLVQGMAVADYLLPGLAAFGDWTRASGVTHMPGRSRYGDSPYVCRPEDQAASFLPLS